MKNKSEFLHNNKVIIILFSIAILINLTWLFLTPNICNFTKHELDGPQYYKNATDILNGEILSKDVQYEKLTRIAIGYPLYLALVRSIFGDHLLPIRIIQIFMVLFGAILLYKMGILLFNKKVGIIAAGIYSLYPVIMYYSHCILTETLNIFLLITSIYFFCRYLKDNRKTSVILSGVTLALATLVRQTTVAFPIIIIIIILINKKFSLKVLSRIVLYIVFFFLTIAPWTIRNYYVTGHIILVNGGVSGFLNVGSDLENDGTWMGGEYYQKLYKDLGVDNDINKRKELLHKMAVENIKNNIKYHPVEYFKLLFIKKPLRMWAVTNGGYFGFPDRFKDDIKHKNYLAIFVKSISLIVYASLLIFSIIGFFYRLKFTWKEKLIFIFIPIYFTLILIPILAISRYVVPTYPFIFMLSAVGISSIFREKNKII